MATAGSSGCRRIPRRSSRSPQASGGEFFAAPDAEGLSRCTRSSARGSARASRIARSPTSSPRSRPALLLVGATISAVLFRRVSGEGRACRLGSSPWWPPRSWPRRPAGAANECDGLQVCVPVAGPVGRRAGIDGLGRARGSSTSSRARAATSSAGSTRGSASGHRRLLPRQAREPGQPRDHDVALGGLPRRRTSVSRDRRCDVPAVHRLHAGGGRRLARSDVGRRVPARAAGDATREDRPRSPRDDDGRPALRRRASASSAARTRSPSTRATPPSASLVVERLRLAADRRRQRRRPGPRRRGARRRSRRSSRSMRSARGSR